ncbi:Peptidyl-prolyl cis-trans isomerase PpiB [hydrothermal vent metagenome]|uniref:peptidylprolyl isomerase n=1 Tax=hydrothermal vent metagenome TaxID=652676 RepID=A0A3B1C8P8_9ZZZZ
MLLRLVTGCLLGFSLLGSMINSAAADAPQVKIETNMGDIIVLLEPDKAPKTVENFLTYAKDGFYNNTIFHRVISNFMIQGGGFTTDYQRKPTRAPIKNEADNGLSNLRGTIAMARTMDPHSATAQFFINVKDNTFLDFTSKSPRGWGYTVFGKVIKGMDTVNRIRSVATGPGGPFPTDVPQEAVIIKSVTLLNPAAPPAPTATTVK